MTMSEKPAYPAEWAHKLPPLPFTVGVIRTKDQQEEHGKAVKKWFTATEVRRGDKGRPEAYISDFGTWLPLIDRISQEEIAEMCYRIPYTFPN